MRARLLFALALVAALFGASVLPSHAVSTALEPLSDMNGAKYINGVICVGSTLNASYYPVAATAQAWNNAVNPPNQPPGSTPPLQLDFSTNCAGDGYIASHRMTIGTFNNPSYNGCLYFTNLGRTPSGGEGQMDYWTQGPGVYINVGISGCVSTAQRRGHQVTAAIGYALGLQLLTSSGWASRVMCTCSLDTIRSPDNTSVYRVFQIYSGSFGG
jgi:hypothetical protein